MPLFLVSSPLSPCPLSHGSAPCLPSSVLSLTALFLVSRPLYPVYQRSQCPLFVALFHWSCPLLCYSVSRPLFLILLSFVPCLSYLRDANFCFKYTCIHLMASYKPVLYLSPISRLCTLSPILYQISGYFISRADLWALSAQYAVKRTVRLANEACHTPGCHVPDPGEENSPAG
jgi:hypothetical protein